LTIDILSYGEPLVRLTPERFKTFLKSDCWNVEIGGAEVNVLVGCSLLGLRTQLISALPDNFLGRKVMREIMKFGVGVDYLRLLNRGRMGLYFLEFAHRAKGAEVLYDREGSTFSSWEIGEKELSALSQAVLLHLTGITPPLSQVCVVNVKRMLLSKPSSLRVSFDLNYRSKLWSPRECLEFVKEISDYIDIMFLKREELDSIFSYRDCSLWENLDKLRGLLGDKIYVVTAAEEGCFVSADGCYIHQPAFPSEVVDPIGAGDAFVAGFLYAYVTGKNLEEAALWGNAMASLKMSVVGDVPAFDRSFVETLVMSRGYLKEVNR